MTVIVNYLMTNSKQYNDCNSKPFNN
jgi:hypothetical protein